jgi:hypothetical protein
VAAPGAGVEEGTRWFCVCCREAGGPVGDAAAPDLLLMLLPPPPRGNGWVGKQYSWFISDDGEALHFTVGGACVRALMSFP